jgi:RHS repeat-associated protein
LAEREVAQARRAKNTTELSREVAGDGLGARPSNPSQQIGQLAAGSPRVANLLPTVSLPKGGGAISGIGEKFSVSAATGSGTLAVPLPLSPGRFAPSLQLTYDSGAGNGPFGFGWALGAAAITRKTDNGLPLYDDGAESDVFLLAGAEDLVSVLDAAGARVWKPRRVHGVDYRVYQYRPRIEGLFSRIERWLAVETGDSHWRTISRDNVTVLYGLDPTSRVADPADVTRIFSWRICRSWNTKGDFALYDYVAEDSAGVDVTATHEANRSAKARETQIYLSAISYGNLTPYVPDWSATGDAAALPVAFAFAVAFDYGDRTPAAPTLARQQPWTVRPDPFSNYRAGFEVRTYRRVQRILFFNNFPNETGVGANRLVRSLDLAYSDQQAAADPLNPIYSFLASITTTGYSAGPGGGVSRSMPPLEFTYSQPRIQSDVLALDRDSLGNLPEGIDEEWLHWVDLDGEGLTGVLAETPASWLYKRNLSANNIVAQPSGAARARFGELETVAQIPSGAGLAPDKRFMDLGGAGRLDFAVFAGAAPGFFKRTDDAGFEPFRAFASLPNIEWSDPNLRLVDLTGDGLADVLITEDGLFTCYPSLGEAGFATALQVRTPWDEEKGPKVILADGTETIFVADMTGDGLNDIVRVRNGEACYWPSLGYGRFGAKITMDQAPRFDAEERFDPHRIHLADIDGSGSADILYVGAGGVRIWFNQSGNAWSAASTIAVFPTASRPSSVRTLDLLGNGTACLVWSSPLPAQSQRPFAYVDLMGGQKPHLLTGVRNNLGAETRISYAPSTRFYLDDRAAGRPWITRLPFPVQTIERVETIDWIGRNRIVSRYAYHHGYFDGYEREFRGFGMVERWDTEEFRTDTSFADGDFVNWDAQSWAPPTLTRTWFHTGAFVNAPTVSSTYDAEYWAEPALRGTADASAMRLPDTVLPDGLDPYEIQEAYRALKGQTLRIEVFAEDGTALAAVPYSITEQNFTLLHIQPRGPNLHAVFLTHPRERLTFNYERSASDPRITHEVTLALDGYGNITRSASAAYPRRAGYAPPEPTLSASMQTMLAHDQTRLHLSASEARYTNAIDDLTISPDDYRTPALAASLSAELTGLAPKAAPADVTPLFAFADLDLAWTNAWTGAGDVAYEAIPSSDVDGAGATAAALTRRILAQSRIFYRKDDLSAVLPAGVIEPRGLPGQSYAAALTPGLLTAIFGASVTPAILAEGGYVQLPGETGWWAPSGQIFYSPGDADTPAQELAVASAHFFLGRRAVDAFGAVTRIDYDAYDLLATTTTDPVGNVITSHNDYRVMAADTVTDPNGNRTAVAFDALGLVAATATMGPAGAPAQGDALTGFDADLDAATLAAFFQDPVGLAGTLIGQATTRVLMDLAAYQRTATSATPSPPAVVALSRETHVAAQAAGATSRVQIAIAYGDGFGREIQRKARMADGPVTDGGAVVSPRWLSSSWVIFDNKGRPVRRYEPFFTASSDFEFSAQTGVSTVMLYDPVGRQVASLHPNQTWSKTVVTAWRQDSWDPNDTVLIGDPRMDADVGSAFARCLGSGSFLSWYAARIGGTFGATLESQAAQQQAAQVTAAHAATPSVTHLDALGRTSLAVADNGGGQRYPTRMALDTAGKLLAVHDALGRRAQENVLRVTGSGGPAYLTGTDMAGAVLYAVNADGGARRTLPDVEGRPIRIWDARGHTFRFTFDAARRPVQRVVVTEGGAEALIELTVWGEGQPGTNLKGRIFRHYDMTGFTENKAFDFKGNLVAGRRQLAAPYRAAPDWRPLASASGAAALDSAAMAANLIPVGDGGRDDFAWTHVYDALDREVQTITPHNAAMQPNVLQWGYDLGGNLLTIDAWLQQAAVPSALLDPASADRHMVSGLAYNARGQRIAGALGDGVATTYVYDPLTFRLTRLTTTRPASFSADAQVVQDLNYFYDPVGNVTSLRDDADTQDVIFFKNQRVEPSAAYVYDPLYRLISASGREHLGQNGGVPNAPQQLANDDSAQTALPQPGDGQAMGVYAETYAYDALGNLLSTAHRCASGSWTRRYAYNEASQILNAEIGTRLSATSRPGDASAGPFSDTYAYDAHGNMTRMPHLPALTWDEEDRLRSTTRQAVNAGSPVTSWYVHSPDGERIRKLTDNMAAAGATPARRTERIYLGELEIYREYAADGMTVTLSRESLRVEAGETTVARVETRTAGTDVGVGQQVRYQFANHLGSAALELDDQGNIISYEEYFPFGATSYQAVANQSDVAKRYRYAGKERDAENDLYYHGARYYAPWLGRWTACDPAGMTDGPAPYAYSRDNPVTLMDPNGAASTDPDAKAPWYSRALVWSVELVFGGNSASAPTSEQEARSAPTHMAPGEGMASAVLVDTVETFLGGSAASAPENEEQARQAPKSESSAAQAIKIAAFVAPVPKGVKVLAGEARAAISGARAESRFVRAEAAAARAEARAARAEARAAKAEQRAAAGEERAAAAKGASVATPVKVEAKAAAAIPKAPPGAVVKPGEVAASSEFTLTQRAIRYVYRATGGKLSGAGPSHVAGMAVQFSETLSLDPVLTTLRTSPPGQYLGAGGAVLSEMPSRLQFAELTRRHGTEFALGHNPATGEIRLFQLGPGGGTFTSPVLLAHTHPMPSILPGAYPWAPSLTDVTTIKNLGQKSSVVVMSSGEAFTFSW